MSAVVYFRQPRPDILDLETLKVQCWRSWFGPQTIPTEIVEALIDTVETLQGELRRAKLDAEIYETMYDNMHTKHNELDALLAQLLKERIAIQNEGHDLTCVYRDPESTDSNFPWSDTGEMMVELGQVGAWTADIQEEECILMCAYCGKEYPSETPTSNCAALTEHIKICPKHPLAKTLDELTTIKVTLDTCGLTGIYKKFDGPADAIEQMVDRLVQLERKLQGMEL